jgi:2-octaprenyl-6-methoxyphenol hydroxylase
VSGEISSAASRRSLRRASRPTVGSEGGAGRGGALSGQDEVEIAVVGAGAAGLAAALAFARDGFRTALIGAPDPRRDGRSVALLDGSVRFLDALGAWSGIRDDAAPLAVMRLIDDSGSLFRPPPATFEAGEIGLEAFGWSVESATLVERLAAVTESRDHLILRSSPADALELGDRPTLRLADGSRLVADLVVAADGRGSRMRAEAGLRARMWSYPQAALTTILAHDREHGNVSTEFHTRDGPFTLVPLPRRRSSLVWVTKPDEAERLAGLDDAGLALAVERRARSFLGRMRLKGPRGVARLSGLSVDRFVAPGLALVAEAAHVFPPIGAQGLNLGLRDVAALRDVAVAARAAGQPIGGACLEEYQQGRDLDVHLRTTAVHGLNRTLLTDFLPADLLRGAGLIALSGIGPLRRAVMREGVLPQLNAPRLMRP